jgi:HSP20 family protein
LISVKVWTGFSGLLSGPALWEMHMTDAPTNVPVTEAKAADSSGTEMKESGKPTIHREWWPFENLRQEVERVFEDFQHGRWRLPFTRTPFDLAPVWPGEFMWSAHPAVEIVERDQDYVITAEMPGVALADVKVNLADDRLTIAGEKKDEKQEERKGVHLSERRYGSFQRTFRVPEAVDAGKITASFANGVLTVTMPKSAHAQTSNRTIDVKAA